MVDVMTFHLLDEPLCLCTDINDVSYNLFLEVIVKYIVYANVIYVFIPFVVLT